MNEVQTSIKVGTQDAMLAHEQKKSGHGDDIALVEQVSKQEGLRQEKDREERPQSAVVEEVKSNLEKLNGVLPVTSTNLSFEFDENGDPPFIRVIDKSSEKVIREIPSEEFREVAKALDELADKLEGKGLLFDRTA
ncbi:flagellar protein FlaG [Pseudoalteromonas luteoviolacea]|uniref:Flagellar protein FlaG n=1 Tax=Pseudoalteromonas luteoviolacea DSM 6061 TaxID=1365250 RepID=A0A166VLD7_9GAMM|nr:flagellar protein FlaG [Pseudoalteromonas luteoviolacea]KZN32995.1 hypothetical protein N475_20965 [Pseudoalteromonas luteoviolacea DSM 6061]KZN55662.1 hypothetical protein N474_14035 [Pseudoalteromonas luteoviolacea CPMOR-2]MBE0385287.1 flagellar protein FlaG [Pseudoalteromonas luteoviolacea DSM 6061]